MVDGTMRSARLFAGTPGDTTDSQVDSSTLPKRDRFSDRFRFPSVFVEHVPRTASGVQPLKDAYDLDKLKTLLHTAADPENPLRPRSLKELIAHLVPAQKSGASVSPLRRLGQGYLASDHVSLTTAGRLHIEALDPTQTLVFVGHTPPNDTSFLPLERNGCNLHSPTSDFLAPLAYAITATFRIHVRMHVRETDVRRPIEVTADKSVL